MNKKKRIENKRRIWEKKTCTHTLTFRIKTKWNRHVFLWKKKKNWCCMHWCRSSSSYCKSNVSFIEFHGFKNTCDIFTLSYCRLLLFLAFFLLIWTQQMKNKTRINGCNCKVFCVCVYYKFKSLQMTVIEIKINFTVRPNSKITGNNRVIKISVSVLIKLFKLSFLKAISNSFHTYSFFLVV